MKRLIRKHAISLLAFSALFFAVLIIAYFAWGVGYIIFQVGVANNSQTNTGAEVNDFNLQGAAGLNYRGVAPTPVASS